MDELNHWKFNENEMLRLQYTEEDDNMKLTCF